MCLALVSVLQRDSWSLSLTPKGFDQLCTTMCSKYTLWTYEGGKNERLLRKEGELWMLSILVHRFVLSDLVENKR